MDTIPGRAAGLLKQKYKLLRTLGAGGAARVFVAEDLVRHQLVAIKVLRGELAATLSAERFLAEINTTAKFRHPNIVPLLDSGTTDGLPYYVMPLVEGESVRARLGRAGPMSPGEAVHVVGQVAAALDYAHSRRVVHRDIKPENVMLAAGRAMVLDFGIALALDSVEDPRWTIPGRVPGTVEYMSPEQASGDPVIDGRSDVYSLACVVYEMVSGAPPFTGPLPCVIRGHLETEPTMLSALCPGVPEAFAEATSRALAKAREDRYPSSGAFVAALREAIDPDDLPCGSAHAVAWATGGRMLYSRQ